MSLAGRSPRATLLAAILALGLVAVPPAEKAIAQGGGAVPSEPPGPGTPAAPSTAPAQDSDVQERAKGLYAFLRGRQVNIHSLYENETFRGYFSDEDVLENYIAYLTSRLGEHKFRKHRIERVEIENVKAAGPDRATARVKLIGRHRDTLVFWDQTFRIEDNWRRIEGEWFVFPPPF